MLKAINNERSLNYPDLDFDVSQVDKSSQNLSRTNTSIVERRWIDFGIIVGGKIDQKWMS